MFISQLFFVISECGKNETLLNNNDVATRPENSMDEATGKFVLKLLAEEKLNQVNIQCIMQETTSIIRTAVKRKLDDVSTFLSSKNMNDDGSLLSQFEDVDDPFHLLKNQKKQNQFFSTKFGIYISVQKFRNYFHIITIGYLLISRYDITYVYSSTN